MDHSPSKYSGEPGVCTLLDLIDATREIAAIPNFNGPSGRLLGNRLREYLEENKKLVEDLTIRELTEISVKAGREYNEAYERANAVA